MKIRREGFTKNCRSFLFHTKNGIKNPTLFVTNWLLQTGDIWGRQWIARSAVRILVYCITDYKCFTLQSWEAHSDLSLAVLMYFGVTGGVCVYCWLGNELSEQVRKAFERSFLFNFLHIVFYLKYIWTLVYLFSYLLPEILTKNSFPIFQF